ncbi:hypothetical protein [Lonsdalea quercina]|uniref:hypothetical protein n=1 Tax=Lonsdalea quercina TaxID=71657 RepID=UPI0039769A40
MTWSIAYLGPLRTSRLDSDDRPKEAKRDENAHASRLTSVGEKTGFSPDWAEVKSTERWDLKVLNIGKFALKIRQSFHKKDVLYAHWLINPRRRLYRRRRLKKKMLMTELPMLTDEIAVNIGIIGVV